jgi:hypothetical protein
MLRKSSAAHFSTASITSRSIRSANVFFFVILINTPRINDWCGIFVTAKHNH